MYEIIDGFVWIEDTGRVHTYGLRTPSGRVMMDITTRRERASEFTAKLNHCNASEIHVMDLVYDFIG